MKQQVDDHQPAEAPSRLEALVSESRDGYAARWDELQSRFVDEPRRAVEEADRLVEAILQQVTSTGAAEREQLARTWSADGEADTEAMRTTLQGYRRLFAFVLR